MVERAYFDWNATAPLRDEARDAVTAVLSLTGNESSVHAEGRAARRLQDRINANGRQNGAARHESPAEIAADAADAAA